MFIVSSRSYEEISRSAKIGALSDLKNQQESDLRKHLLAVAFWMKSMVTLVLKCRFWRPVARSPRPARLKSVEGVGIHRKRRWGVEERRGRRMYRSKILNDAKNFILGDMN